MRLEDNVLIDAYCLYRQKSKDTPKDNEYADYGWEKLPEKLNADWLGYGLFLIEASRSLANLVNQLGNYAHRLRAWDAVLGEFDEDQDLELLHEFVDPIATVVLNLPYAIQSRFIFTTTHLSHQANKALLGTTWRDDLPDDRKISIKIARKYAKGWSCFKDLDAAISAIFSDEHRQKTNEFRHKYNHQLPTQVIIWHSTFVRRSRKIKPKRVTYDFGHFPPINISLLADEMVQEFKLSLSAFKSYKLLVAQQITAIKHNNPLP